MSSHLVVFIFISCLFADRASSLGRLKDLKAMGLDTEKTCVLDTLLAILTPPEDLGRFLFQPTESLVLALLNRVCFIKLQWTYL